MLQNLSGSRHLIPWSDYFVLGQRGFAHLPRDNRITANLRWRLQPTIVSTTRLFYEQAAATCQFLYHAEGGKYRARLLDYVVNYYSGKTLALTPRAAFGLSGKELGKRTEQFAKAVAHGWTPK